MPTPVTNSQEWKDCLRYIAQRTKEQSYNAWLKPTSGALSGNGNFDIAVPNQFVADWISQHFRVVIEESFREVLGRDYQINYVITKATDPQTQLVLPNGSVDAPKPQLRSAWRSNMNARYNFNTLVVGDFNQFACAASMVVAEAPGMTSYNPLLIYGGTGLGKTHIVQAIGHRILESFPHKRVLYGTSEKFTSDFIASISEGSVTEFTRSYRDVDVLIIDDIQFFSGKESTQEQFFHTFNTLYHYGKQIVLSADRPPKEIKGLEERLLSRFASGLVTDLQAPDLENRIAILYKKLESGKATLPEDVVRYIASQVSTNVRELEGTLIRLLAYGSLKKVPISIEVAQQLLSGELAPKRKQPTIEIVQRKTAEFFSVELAMMKAKKKTSHIALARQVAMYLSRSLTSSSLKAIGREFGGRDHSTVIHACNLVGQRMAADAHFREQVDNLIASILY